MPDKPWTGRKILIIDDSKSVREALKLTYSGLGLQVVGMAENGIAGLEMIKIHRPEIVNLDLIMPEMDGVECFRKIRELNSEIRCLINSWLSGESKVLTALADLIPFFAFQPKTTSPQALEARLEILYDPQKAAPPPRGSREGDISVDLSSLGVKVS